ncbi:MULTISPECIES: hypothetical protein [unclassified Sphingobacterium]|uniref:hypothetical protein n=1 Tax=unclassified Sphingobacterium TaxID=2609468 RepID=UPI0025DA8C67|nr:MULTISPECIES: hypothetical protein [unclassified Sphingobacterium]
MSNIVWSISGNVLHERYEELLKHLSYTKEQLTELISYIKNELKVVVKVSKKEIEKITIEKAMEMLKEVGINVNQEDAELIMEFLYNLVEITIRECFAEYMD